MLFGRYSTERAIFFGSSGRLLDFNNVLAAAKIEELREKAYSVGPFGIRVGFAYQQERALNLAYALVKSGKIAPSHKVLVAGGGLAGATVRMALKGMGIGDVSLYEARDSILTEQHAAEHRAVHPCYNNWPLANYFSPTSNFPFLNWFSANAATVVSFLSRRWDEIYFRDLTSVKTGYVLKGMELEDKDDPDSRIEATFENPNKTRETLFFDRAVLALGFGVEKDLNYSFIGSYWSPDNLDVVREDKNDNRRIVVSGIGDGGLMDFVRLSFRRDPERDLAIEAISYLRHSSYFQPRTSLLESAHRPSYIETRIREIETQAGQYLTEAPFPRHDFGCKAENEIATTLEEGYLSIVAELPNACERFLKSRVHPTIRDDDRLQLVGRLVAPFTLATAPINKLLVAYLLKQNPKLYLQGYVDVKSSPSVLVRPDKSRETLDDRRLILRHGASPPAFEISKSFEKQNRALSRTLSNLVEHARSDEELCVGVPGMSMKPAEPAYREYRIKLAKAFARICCGMHVTSRYNRSRRTDPFYFLLKYESFADLEEMARKFGGFPHELFGVKLLASQLQDADLGFG